MKYLSANIFYTTTFVFLFPVRLYYLFRGFHHFHEGLPCTGAMVALTGGLFALTSPVDIYKYLCVPAWHRDPPRSDSLPSALSVVSNIPMFPIRFALFWYVHGLFGELYPVFSLSPETAMILYCGSFFDRTVQKIIQLNPVNFFWRRILTTIIKVLALYFYLSIQEQIQISTAIALLLFHETVLYSFVK